jgi:putative holliday junction resolvase
MTDSRLRIRNLNVSTAIADRKSARSLFHTLSPPKRRLCAKRAVFWGFDLRLSRIMSREKMAIAIRAKTRVIPGAAHEKKPPRILAIDYGRKRIGLALSDELGLTAQPLSTLSRTNRRNDLRRLREICRVHGVTQIVVGHPLHMTGETGPMADEAARFASRVKKELGIEVELQDERLTSWEAKQTVVESKTRKRISLDDVAAAVLLRDYLEQKRSRMRAPAAEKD